MYSTFPRNSSFSTNQHSLHARVMYTDLHSSNLTSLGSTSCISLGYFSCSFPAYRLLQGVKSLFLIAVKLCVTALQSFCKSTGSTGRVLARILGDPSSIRISMKKVLVPSCTTGQSVRLSKIQSREDTTVLRNKTYQ